MPNPPAPIGWTSVSSMNCIRGCYTAKLLTPELFYIELYTFNIAVNSLQFFIFYSITVKYISQHAQKSEVAASLCIMLCGGSSLGEYSLKDTQNQTLTITLRLCHTVVWLSGRVVREPDLWWTGRGFESQSPGCGVQRWASWMNTLMYLSQSEAVNGMVY